MKNTYPYNRQSFNFYGISLSERLRDKLGIAPLVYETTFQVNGHALPKPEGLNILASSHVDPCKGLACMLSQIGTRTTPTGRYLSMPEQTQEYLLPDGTSVLFRPENIGSSIENYGATAALARVRSHSRQVPRWLREVFATIGEPVLPQCRVYRVEDLREDEGAVNVRTSTRKDRALTSALAEAAIALFEPEKHRAEGRFTYEADAKRYFARYFAQHP